MGERTPNLKLYKPSIVPLEVGWGEEVNRNFDKIDELLAGAAQSAYLIAGKVNYVANAVYTNGVWNRLNTGMGAVRLALDPSAQTITVYYAAAGSNPISWTTLQTFSSGGLNAGAKKITNLPTPTAASDAATKAYVDGLIAKVMPYRPYTWETESLPYDDRSPTTLVTGISKGFYSTETLIVSWTCDTPTPRYVHAIIPIRGGSGVSDAESARIVVNGETVYTTGSWPKGTTKTTDAVLVCPGEVLNLYVKGKGGNPTHVENCSLVDTGYQVPINLDLQGWFLALDQDFGTLTATLTFGDEADVPFTEYPNRFPYAPNKITISRHKLEDRPVIKVYKGV